jgi:nicotinate-nucleotide--dimethylbenzimidazole phosphoribosyltransferase
MSDFGDEARRVLYDVIARRRDIRHFREGAPLSDATLARILAAAHQAPSVGYSQPWDFIVVRDVERRRRIRASFLRVRAAEAARFPAGERRDKYLSYRLEGILESALNVCVTADLRPADEAVLGTTAQPESLRASALCAVQNLWLAARVEGIGVGWVSIVEPAVLRHELALPPGVEPVAYLCLGEPLEFRDRPLLEETGWRARRPLIEATHDEQYHASIRKAPSPPNVVAAPLKPIAPPAEPREKDGIPPFSTAAAAAAREHQTRLCKPRGSLGRLEDLAAYWAGARGSFPAPPPERVSLYVFAGDHGVVEEGVSAWSSAVTAAMVGNFLSGGAAVNQLARALDVGLAVVDVGVAGDLSALPAPGERVAELVSAKVRAGTANLRHSDAMSRTEAEAALAVGQRLAAAAATAGVQLLCAGEMGIGNSTAAAALLCALAGVPPALAVGRGAGLDDAGVARKVAVVSDALARHARARRDEDPPGDVLGTLAAVGGLEIAAMAGLMLGGAAARVPVIVDGFISGAAALVAVALDPRVRDYLLVSHRSAETGAAELCRALGLEPLLDLGMRLGEGTGALLAVELVRHAVRLQLGMATFSQAGVPGRAGLVIDGD